MVLGNCERHYQSFSTLEWGSCIADDHAQEKVLLAKVNALCIKGKGTLSSPSFCTEERRSVILIYIAISQS